MKEQYRFVSKGIQVGPLQLKHRMVMGPMGSRMSTIYGEVTQQMIDYYAARIGDCLEPRAIADAVHEGACIARSI